MLILSVIGAGISVHAGIPDFRSSEGLFQSLKKENPVASGKDLFDASVFNVSAIRQGYQAVNRVQSEQTTLIFCQMIARLSELSKAAEPTPFHRLLRSLDLRGRLLRVYTQNIDALEVKSGLSFGVPQFNDRRNQYRPKAKQLSCPPTQEPDTEPATTPRCIPLHGTLQMLHCQICTYSFPLEDHLLSLSSGILPQCPECTSVETTRQLVGKRARGIGKLRPSVVLYNEAHKDGEGVGEAARKDLVGSSKGKGRSGADLLLVVGTSLRVPGTKKMVRQFAKAVHARGSKDGASSLSSSPSPAPRQVHEDEPSFKSVYLNLDFPVPTREWEGVFDVWVQGDAQKFGQMLQEELDRIAKAKELAEEKRRRKEELVLDTECPSPTKSTKKRKSTSDSSPARKRRLLTPPPTPTRKPQSQSKRRVLSDDALVLPRLIAEVVISRPPPTTPKKTHFANICPFPTPEKSPHRPINFNAGFKPPWASLLAPLAGLDESEHYQLGSRLAVSYERTAVK